MISSSYFRIRFIFTIKTGAEHSHNAEHSPSHRKMFLKSGIYHSEGCCKQKLVLINTSGNNKVLRIFHTQHLTKQTLNI